MRRMVIHKNDSGQRIDKFLTKAMPALPQGMLYKGFRKNCVKRNGKHEKDIKAVLQEGDVLELYFKDMFFETKNTPVFGRSDICVVYEDKNIIIMDKPAGLSCHPDATKGEDSLVDRMKSYLYQKGAYDPQKEQSFTPALCNRLDKNTAGLVIGGKTAAAVRVINEKIRNREIKKFYLCLAEGVFFEKHDTLAGYLLREDKQVKITDQAVPGAKPVKTSYTVLEQYKDSALLEIELHTGRTHQIRAQLAACGHPLRGDVKYGGKRGQGMQYQQLTAYKLVMGQQGDWGELDYLKGKEFVLS